MKKFKIVKTIEYKIDEFLREKFKKVYSDIKTIYPVIYYNILNNAFEFYVLSFFNVIDSESSCVYIYNPFAKYFYDLLIREKVIHDTYSNRQAVFFYIDKILKKYAKRPQANIGRKLYILSKKSEVYKKYLIYNYFDDANLSKMYHDYLLYTILFDYISKLKESSSTKTLASSSPIYVYRADDINDGELIHYDLILTNELILKNKEKRVFILPVELIRNEEDIKKAHYLKKGPVLFFNSYKKGIGSLQHIVDVGSYVVPYEEIKTRKLIDVNINIEHLQTKINNIFDIANLENVKLNKDVVGFVLL